MLNHRKELFFQSVQISKTNITLNDMKKLRLANDNIYVAYLNSI